MTKSKKAMRGCGGKPGAGCACAAADEATSRVAQEAETPISPVPLEVSTDELFFGSHCADLPIAWERIAAKLPKDSLGVMREMQPGTWSRLLKAWPNRPAGSFELYGDGHLVRLPRSNNKATIDASMHNLEYSNVTEAYVLQEEPAAAIILRRHSLILLYPGVGRRHERGLVVLDPDATGHETMEELNRIESDFPGLFKLNHT